MAAKQVKESQKQQPGMVLDLPKFNALCALVAREGGECRDEQALSRARTKVTKALGFASEDGLQEARRGP